MIPEPVRAEANRVREILNRKIDMRWDGKKCIQELKDADYNWRQMEWIGWYLEYMGRKILIDNYGGKTGPIYGRTSLDYQNHYVWDFKSHPVNSSGHPWAITNDCEAVNRCIEDNGGMGFIIALGEATYNDDDRTFRDWHEGLKGGKSAYVKHRIARGAPSRKRKVAFNVKEYLMIFIEGKIQIEKAIMEGWLSGDAQIGWRNSGGSPRRAKYKINCEEVPQWAKA